MIVLATVIAIVLADVGVYLARPYPESPVTIANSQRVHRFMPREQFDTILGLPASIEDVPDNGGHVAVWNGDGVSVIAGFDPPGRATHLICVTWPPDGPLARLRHRLGLVSG